ncbi:MAG: hypothetical protein RDU20_19140, partial [Desulfomonilaceae bacterium]|nr:hypothetical protein [Desulfomonilaceae bacterium]
GNGLSSRRNSKRVANTWRPLRDSGVYRKDIESFSRFLRDLRYPKQCAAHGMPPFEISETKDMVFVRAK